MIEAPRETTSSCDKSSAGQPRRGFLAKAIALACGGVTLLGPAAVGIVALLNPLRQKSLAREFLKITTLPALPDDGTPQRFPVVADRVDAWSRYARQPIGSIFLRRTGNDDQPVEALQVLCPHVGCTIEYQQTPQGGKYFCPCHEASFDLSGKRTDEKSPSPRDMDTLEVDVRNKTEVWVKFENFRTGAAEKVAQVMKPFLDWLDHRTGLPAAWRRWAEHRVPGGACWCKVWPGAVALTFLVQAITGFFLWAHYSPNDQSAWESVYYLQHHVAGGWLLRAVHHYAAQMLLVLVGIYVIQLIVTGAYRAPREAVFWTAVLMGMLALPLLLTGDLLAWDQNSYAGTSVRVGFLRLLPGVGDALFKIAIGGPGPAFGHLALPRFLALHVGVFAGGFLVVLLLHGVLARRADAAEAAQAERTAPFWPDQAARVAVAALLVLIVVLALALQHGVSGDHVGAPLGSPADLDPANKYAGARPEWAFRGLYAFSELFPGERAILPIFVIPGVLVCIVLAMPFVGRFRVGHWFNVAVIAVVLVGITVLSLQSLAKDRNNAKHQAAVDEERRQADRVLQLIRAADGIPAEGALSLLRSDPLTQGPRLFRQYCASCHDHTDAEGTGIKAEESTAPNLHAYASRQWLAGLLDPERINTPEYFGNTALRNGKMAGFVEESLSDLEDDEKEDVAKIVMALSAEAGLKSQRALDAGNAEQIRQGRALMADDYGCTSCHKFHDKGQLGRAPELTGYGSREWLTGIIANPAQTRFYGERNDRMPAYAESPDDETANTLSAEQIRLLVDWLRGE